MPPCHRRRPRLRHPTVRLGVSVVAVAAALMTGGQPAGAGADVIVAYAGNGNPGRTGDGGPAGQAEIQLPAGLALSAAGDLFIADAAANQVRRVDPAGVISTVAGTGHRGFAGDGMPATAADLDGPTGLALDTNGNLFVADSGNNRVRRIDAAGVITTVAGGARGGCEPGSPAAALCRPTGLAIAGNGPLFVADTGHDIVRRLEADGTLTTVAGTGEPGFSGNSGAATSAALRQPTGLALAGSALLIADTGNHQVRKVNGGTITAFAGNGEKGFAGDGGQATSAELRDPTGLAVDPLGNAVVVDGGNWRVRRVDPSGVISTVAGVGLPGDAGDDGPALEARMRPHGPALSGAAADVDDVYVADSLNRMARRVHKDGPPPALPESPGSSVLLLASSVALVAGGGLVTAKMRRRRSGNTGPARQ